VLISSLCPARRGPQTAQRPLARIARPGVGGTRYDGRWFQRRRYRGIDEEPTCGRVPIHHSHGRQKFSWIFHIDDVLAAILFLGEREDLDGPVNLSSPNPSDSGPSWPAAPDGRHPGRDSRPALAARA